MIKTVDIYKEIFLGTIVIDNEENNYCFKINFKKTIINIKQKYDINEKIIYDLLHKYKYFSSYPKSLFPMDCLLESISNDIANNIDIKIEFNKSIFKQIENMYKKYQQFKSFSINLPIIEHETVLGQYPIIECIKKNSGFNMEMTPESELKSNLQEHCLDLLTDILIMKGINLIKEMLNTETNELSIKSVNELTNCLSQTNNYYHKNSL